MVYADLDPSSPIPKPFPGPPVPNVLSHASHVLKLGCHPRAMSILHAPRHPTQGTGSLPLSLCVPSREAEATYAHLLMCDGRALLEDTQHSGSPSCMVSCPRTVCAAT